MISFSYKKRGIGRKITLFYNNENLPKNDLKEIDIIEFKGAYDKPNLKSYKTQDTLVTNLNKSEEDLFQKIDKQYRYEIRRAEKENLISRILDSSILKETDIYEFEKFYNEFADEKGLSHCYTDFVMRAYKSNKLVISYVYEGTDTKYEKPLVTHVYISNEKESRLLHSCSHFRGNTDGQYRNLVGRANRYLHWKDICYFKDKGLNMLDWGGAGKSEEVKSITEFKRKFGGEEKVVYNYFKANSFKGRLYLFICKMLKRL